eukprot:s328_g7.t1
MFVSFLVIAWLSLESEPLVPLVSPSRWRETIMFGQPRPADRQIQAFQRDPFGMDGMMMPFGGQPGGFGFGGLFGSMFGQMNQMMEEMDQMMMNQQSRGATPGMSAMSSMSSGGGFSCQTFSFSSRMGPDGQMHTEQYSSSAVGDRSRDMHEVQQMYSNSSTGVDKMSMERQLEGRARKMVKERTRSTMEERQTDMYRGMNEEDAAEFDRHWQERAAPHLPQHQQGFSRMLGNGGRYGGPPSHGQAALPGYGGYAGYPAEGGYNGYAPQRTGRMAQGTQVYEDTRPNASSAPSAWRSRFIHRCGEVPTRLGIKARHLRERERKQ